MEPAAQDPKLTELGQKVLSEARARAAEATGYDSQQWRKRLAEKFPSKLGIEAHAWQLDVSEAAFLGVDCICIAGTGSGKTMPFVMPLMVELDKRVLLLSPLKVLQEEQARRFQEMGISAATINQDTFNGALRQVSPDSMTIPSVF
ncbi:hypothetical protein FA13DRAFT_1651472 [Coprinellus micaceus]|uniref:DEAD/DEAH-box helicase domain-containing protein n=1 Tax=Coprinellus micaceus TaxID=71717 RepID=A0A4Y7S0Z8_COPMI|nr:hypothetical protein FA13DRAFT_1651472 [Coprinellus micaceus]